MPRLREIADGFWNLRGSFKTLGFLDIGTHCSLVRLQSGRFVMLDAYTLDERALEEVRALTDGGDALEAFIHLHPFHTIHVKRAAKQFPDAKLYGTQRHQAKAPGLAWEPERTEEEAFHALYADDFDFLVPVGVHFIPANERLHFASVLAIHRASQTLHVDDTLNWIPLPWVRALRFHPTLSKVLHDHPEAANDFREWARELATRSENVRNVVVAHAGRAGLVGQAPGAIAAQIRDATRRVEKTLRKHERR